MCLLMDDRYGSFDVKALEVHALICEDLEQIFCIPDSAEGTKDQLKAGGLLSTVQPDLSLPPPTRGSSKFVPN